MDKSAWERTLSNLSGYDVEIDGPLGVLDRDVATRWKSDAVTVESEVGVATVRTEQELASTLIAHVHGCRALAKQKKRLHDSTCG